MRCFERWKWILGVKITKFSRAPMLLDHPARNTFQHCFRPSRIFFARTTLLFFNSPWINSDRFLHFPSKENVSRGWKVWQKHFQFFLTVNESDTNSYKIKHPNLRVFLTLLSKTPINSSGSQKILSRLLPTGKMSCIRLKIP